MEPISAKCRRNSLRVDDRHNLINLNGLRASHLEPTILSINNHVAWAIQVYAFPATLNNREFVYTVQRPKAFSKVLTIVRPHFHNVVNHDANFKSIEQA